ncbi:putative hemin-degrading protein [Escherichia coli]|uniref:Putative hemin-degrading protein n=1 Tax=Escherichia coli TaxID=562 RepID=A0A376MKB3_ECOLX|nr:putative hemin-degrading protein [Escherichia coli]
MNHYNTLAELKEQNPGKYARDIAGLMNISEAELAFARVTHDAWRMCGDIRDILAALESVGETKCICRNEYAVHEQVGAFTKPAFERTCRIDPQIRARWIASGFSINGPVFFTLKKIRLVANARVFSSLIIRAMHY